VHFGDGGEVLPIPKANIFCSKGEDRVSTVLDSRCGEQGMAVMCCAYGSVSLKGPVLMAALLMRMSIDLVIFLVSSTACYPIYITGLRISEIARQIVKLIPRSQLCFF
jgi:hypothetical protein